MPVCPTACVPVSPSVSPCGCLFVCLLLLLYPIPSPYPTLTPISNPMARMNGLSSTRNITNETALILFILKSMIFLTHYAYSANHWEWPSTCVSVYECVCLSHYMPVCLSDYLPVCLWFEWIAYPVYEISWIIRLPRFYLFLNLWCSLLTEESANYWNGYGVFDK